MTIRALALDLERTLVSDAIRGIPRPGLFEFLTFCLDRFDRLLLFTCVEKADSWSVLEGLCRRGAVPGTFLERLTYIEWHGDYKDLQLIPDAMPHEVLLVDDDESWVRPDQKEQWLAIAGWDGDDPRDRELPRIQRLLEEWLD